MTRIITQLTLAVAVLLAACATTSQEAQAANVPSFSIGNATADEASGQICFPVTKSGTFNSKPSYLYFTTLDGTAKANSDYVPQSSLTITFQPTEAKKDVCVALVNDNVPEATETMTGKLLSIPNKRQATQNARLYDGTATGTITDGDVAPPPPPTTKTCPDGSVIPSTETCPAAPPPPPPSPPTFTCQDVSIQEGFSPVTVVCSKTGNNGQPSQLEYSTGGGMPTATPGEDYTPTSGGLTIPFDAQGFTFMVPITDDAVSEQPETFGTLIKCITNCAVGHLAQITITDNDLPPVPCPDGTTVPAGQTCPTPPTPTPSAWLTIPWPPLKAATYVRTKVDCPSSFDSRPILAGTVFKLDPLGDWNWTPYRTEADVSKVDGNPAYFVMGLQVDNDGNVLPSSTTAYPLYIDCLEGVAKQ